MNDPISLEAAERQLDRIQSFIPRIDNRVSFLFSATAAQMAIAVLNVTSVDLQILGITLVGIAYLLATGWVVMCLYNCTFPNLKGGAKSIVYFKDIASFEEREYVEKFGSLSPIELRDAILSQIWRNAQIVDEKYRLLQWAWRGTWVALILWVILLASTSWINQRIPFVGY